MKYDAEYNSYKFSKDELSMIVNALVYYRKFHRPESIYESLDMGKLIDDVYESQHIPLNSQ